MSWRTYNCDRCGNDFASQIALKLHFRTQHIGKDICDMCGREILRESMQEHKQVIHFNQRLALVSPQRETLFIATETCLTCRLCRKAFGTIFGREQHERQHHDFTTSKRARMSTGFSPHSILFSKGSQQLRQFVDAKLRPVTGLVKIDCSAEVETMIRLLIDCCPVSVNRAVKGGSFIKGTDTQDWSDIDIVFFSESFRSLEDCKQNITPALEALEENLKKTSMANRMLIEKKTRVSLRFQMMCFKNLHSHQFDVMLCYNALSHRPSQDEKNLLYKKLYSCGDSSEVQLYSLCLLQDQVDFVKITTKGVKDLICLAKYWMKTSFARPDQENRFRRLPSSYTLELLTLYAWQQAGKPIFFNLLQGLRAVLLLLVNYLDICIVWYEHYSPSSWIVRKALQHQTRPFILDPANPTFNVCENCNAWDEVAVVAKQSLLKPLLNGVQCTGPWSFIDGN
ncbi:2'-5'-oligoadenylate synthase 1-like [Erpetoichthys calabaricus]|uniref:2'-5'-oligoadenylate synthase 1-like n=1 Tax=Erpetoichthys calabaricus TaxID=27687 RepID=UPI002234D41E|nr:2'-5'-oligoadenylate synthase 1-like [Erpetoichthys calabaricus]